MSVSNIKKKAISSKSIATNLNSAGASQKNQLSKGLVLQTYCNTVLLQPNVDFSAEPDLKTFQTQINNSLTTAKTHANSYLNGISPRIISAISALDNYFTIYKSVPVTLPEGSTVEQWIDVLSSLKSISETNLRTSQQIAISLEDLYDNLSSDSKDFQAIVSQVNTAVGGDKGILDSINESLQSVNKEIAGTIVAVVGEGLGIAGGVFTIVVGAVADFVTVGTNPELVIGGVVMVVAGVAAEAGTIVALTGLYDQKSQLLSEQSKLTTEVSLLNGISASFSGINTQVKEAEAAAKAMENAWKLLGQDLEVLIDDLQSGILTTNTARTMFLNEANSEIEILQTQIQTIKDQMAGVQSKVLPIGKTVKTYLAEMAKNTNPN